MIASVPGEILPTLNASLNALTIVWLVAGLIAIKNKRIEWHRWLMSAALLTSALFLTSYLIYHFGYRLQNPFQGEGWTRPVYFFILFSHIILAIVNLPMILMTFTLGWRRRDDRHRAWARWTWPVWMYVSITGVLVYLMLYVWFPGQES